MTTTTPTAPAPRVGRSTFLAVWIALGVLSAVGMTYGLSAVEGGGLIAETTALTPATSVGVAALCYLGAAATRTR